MNITPTIPNAITIGNHNGLVTHHQLQSIFPVSLSVKNTINIIVNILELMIDVSSLEFVSSAISDSFHPLILL